MSMIITLLLYLVIIATIYWGVNYIAGNLGFPEPIPRFVRVISTVIVVIVIVMILLQLLGGAGGDFHMPRVR